MKRRWLRLLSLFLIIGCGRPAVEPSRRLPDPVPSAIVVDRYVSGPTFGQTIQNPLGLATDHRGLIYLVDAGNNRLVQFDSTLTPLQSKGGFGSQAGLLSRPMYVTVDNNLNLLVSDAGNRRLCRFDSHLNFVNDIVLDDPEDPLRYGTPSGVAVASYGSVWLADREKNRLVLLNNVGQFDRFVGDFGYSGGQLQSPMKLLFGADDNVYVCDPGNSRIVVYDSYGGLVQTLTDPNMIYPVAADLDRESRLWVLDQSNGRIFCFSSDGRPLHPDGFLILGLGDPLDNPSDLVLLPGHRLLLSDSGNNRLVLCKLIVD